ncbi:hypothetical protein B0T24DRAFT_557943 [Lasiosphaeria ovina]|uniref:RING-type E3 ubiquitin transferase n=1 Tax=Lasiosphaeria ovina TaxID=92902 RepID=A0AAE0K488_9PEZI|nr:hypothetical protein B0T24DRAFT_557943 [Lasiosphaeria ovina]
MSDARIDPFLGHDPARFPNTRLRASAASEHSDSPDPDGQPSLFRTAQPDPAPSTDPDTCRICRGEKTAEEPLFYPCKCSGSIKFVHQDCLMEWLSHSQKKHCELCKTPFRFTKLYAHDMPKVLPFHVFVSHMAKYTVRNLLVWLRAALVVSVWLGWLPYLMRSVWSFLFWISDEGLGGGSSFFGRQNATAGDSFNSLAATNHATGVCPSSPLFAPSTTVATIGGVLDGLPVDSVQLVKGLYSINLTSADPLYSTILRLLFGTVGLAEKPAATASNASVSILDNALSPSASHHSLLSEVGFLRNMTRHASINRTIIATLEGQIITILVIVCFILIILVRDYVVQQQPEINMRAAFAAAENPVPQPPLEDPGVRAEDIEHLAGPGEEEPVDDNSDEEAAQASMAADHTSNQSAIEDQFFLHRQTSDSSALGASEESMLAPILDVHRNLTNPGGPTASLLDHERTTVNEYLEIYREAGGDPEKILGIAKERHLEDKLDYWIRLTRSIMDRNRQPDNESSDGGDMSESTAEMSTAAQYATSAATRSTGSGSNQSSEWVWPPDQQDQADPREKGKYPATEEEQGNSEAQHMNPFRPRSNTDGPRVSDTLNPLANNNWSFSDLPHQPLTAPISPSHISATQRDLYPIQPSPTTRGSSNTGDTLPSVVAADPPGSSSPVSEDARQIAEAPLRRQPASLAERVADFMWRDVDAIDPAELAAVGMQDGFGDDDDAGLAVALQDDALADDEERDREVVEAAVAAGLDPEAIEDAEDLEGILELLGMRGPVAGLFQNAIFCAFLVSITIFLGIFVPYNIGRISVWTIANPVRPARMLFSISKFVQDCAVVILGFSLFLLSYGLQSQARLVKFMSFADYMQATTAASLAMALSAANRIAASFMTELPIISASEMRNFSALSHEALLAIKEHLGAAFATVGKLFVFLSGGDYAGKGSEVISVASNISTVAWAGLKDLPDVLSNPGSWVINLNLPETAGTINPELAYWNGVDRFWAIMCGYIAISIIAGLYLRRGTPFSSGQTGQDWEASIIDGLNQASGVMKVILIIGIEMLVFPLYCGMLLDVALLPLFENTSMKSRVLFTVNYPVTSIFVHWFVGTGYMFHFALFVSMCRKIMRKGVLYFIRDPDDPEFHPVRDVLERNVTTQLRKILFSAFVYGALVIVCLGGVVWGLALSLPTVLPIHYSSNEPVLEFPIDLLFYNFLMPLAVKFFRPSDGLHAMYTWWFRKCARVLRITWFLFGERRIDEEGHLALGEESPHRNLPWWRTLFLELDDSGNVIPKTWKDTFEGGTASPTLSIPTDELITLNVKKINLVRSGQLISDGRFVRTPASDQVKIPKGKTVFLAVNENNTRQDEQPDQADTDIYSTNQYQLVFVPPHFRVRVFLFILFIWIFAAVTGVGITIVPLVFGRRMFKLLIPSHIRTNDIYAFSIGIYVLGSVAYTAFHLRTIYRAVEEWVVVAALSAYNRDGVRRVLNTVLRIARVVYAYVFLLLVFPLMVASLMELYALIPLHEFMYSILLSGGGTSTTSSAEAADLNPRHTIRVIQAWTIGLLYLKLGAHFITHWFIDTRLAAAVRAVLRRGWLDPDLAVLTRAFIIPGVTLWAAAVATPLLVAKFTVANGLAEAIVQGSGAVLIDGVPDQPLHDAYLVLIYRLSFPFIALGLAMCITLWSMVGVFRSWKVRIRDEAYLIGERLHNFGVVNGPPRARGAWRASGSRL